MSVDEFGIQGPHSKKKPGPKNLVPALSWLVARIKFCGESGWPSAGGQPRRLSPHKPISYAVLLGLIVKSRNWVRTLDICIPFNCDTNGMISAMNWSFISSLISS
jgi:hypothetical protein